MRVTTKYLGVKEQIVTYDELDLLKFIDADLDRVVKERALLVPHNKWSSRTVEFDEDAKTGKIKVIVTIIIVEEKDEGTKDANDG